MKIITGQIFTVSLILALGLNSCKSTSETTSNSQNVSQPSSAKEILATQNTDASLWFATSAEYYYIAKSTYEMAADRLFEAMKNKRSAKPAAVVLDLDETVLDNSRYQLQLISEGEVYREDSWAEWCSIADAPAIPGSLQFIRRCEELGVKVYFLSNRSVDYLEATLRNLEKLGVNTTFDAVLLKENTSDKTERRRMILESYDIVMYIGDNLRDYSEVFANRDGNYGKNIVDDDFDIMVDQLILLPNPMYGEWQKAFYNSDEKKKISNEDKVMMKKNHAQPVDR